MLINLCLLQQQAVSWSLVKVPVEVNETSPGINFSRSVKAEGEAGLTIPHYGDLWKSALLPLRFCEIEGY